MLLAAGCAGSASSPGTAAPRPVTPGVPVAAAVTGQIGPGGGTLTSADGGLTVTVPDGALTSPVELSIQEITTTAADGVGRAYRLGPEGVALAVPATLTFRTGSLLDGVDALTIAHHDAESGFWVRATEVARDPATKTLSVRTSHLGDWTLVVTPTAQDLAGWFTLEQTVGVPFSATGHATLGFAGEDAGELYYLLPGTITLVTPVALGAATCVPDAATAALPVMIAESLKTPPRFWWSIGAHWWLTCEDGSGASARTLIATEFDTLGINLIGCARGYVGSPVIGRDRQSGTYTIDCGARGAVTATWDFVGVGCGGRCPPSDPCHDGVVSCQTGTAVCLDTGAPAQDGTACGAVGVCIAGVCSG